MNNIDSANNRDKYIININKTNITQYFIDIDNNSTYEILFNTINKQFELYFININKNINIKIIIGPKYLIEETDEWYKSDRPFLRTYYYNIENVNLINDNEINILKYLINDTLNVCRENNKMNFDTDKDIQRQISLTLSKNWYLYPG